MNKISNLKIYKKFLSLISAIIMMATPISALAEGNKDDGTSTIPASDEYDDKNVVQLTFEEYTDYLRNEVVPVMEPFIGENRELLNYLITAYYFPNYKNCRKVRQQLNDMGFLSDNLEDVDLNAREVSRTLAMKNVEILKENIDIDKLFDISLLIIDDKTRELAHSALVNYVAVYEKATINCDEYKTYMEQIEELKQIDYVVVYNFFYNLMEGLYERCIVYNFDPKEIKEYVVLKGNSITDINTKKYKYYINLLDELDKKEEKSELEEYLYLMYSYEHNYTSVPDIEAAFNKIETDYVENLNVIK